MVLPAAGTPPALGEIVYEESLFEPRVLVTRDCPTGLGSSVVVGEGFMIKARGRCTADAPTVLEALTVDGLSMLDGEFRIDFKVTNGWDRAIVNIEPRSQDSPTRAGYGFSIAPKTGRAVIFGGKGDQMSRILAERTDLAGLVRRDDWNSLSVRLLGPSLWMFVNDVPLLSAEDTGSDHGAVFVIVERTGSVDDDQEVAVVFRNLRISRLMGSPAERAPGYQRID